MKLSIQPSCYGNLVMKLNYNGVDYFGIKAVELAMILAEKEAIERKDALLIIRCYNATVEYHKIAERFQLEGFIGRDYDIALYEKI